MILAPFYHRKMTLLEVCLMHSQGFIFEQEGIESRILEDCPQKILVIYVDESTPLTDFYDSFFRVLESESKGKHKQFRGMVLSASFMADLLKEPDGDRLYRIARPTTLHKEVDGKVHHALLGVCTDKNLPTLLDILETPSVQFNFKKAFQTNSVLVLVRTDALSKTEWITKSIRAYHPRLGVE